MKQRIGRWGVSAAVFVVLLAAAPAGYAVRPAAAQASVEPPPAPALTSPASDATLPLMEAELRWSLPSGATQVQVQVNPLQGDGPGVNLILGATGSLYIPPPPAWYGLLPNMTYEWRARASAATSAVGEADASWGPWSAPRRFGTPAASAASISFTEPRDTALVLDHAPVLTWLDSNPAVWYYEVQVSRDAGFGPAAPLYWELRHGGVTVPPRSYTVPSQQQLQPGITYYWRVRPRVQGDGTPVPWSPASRFTTPSHQDATLVDDGGTLRVRVGDTLGVNLGEDYEWQFTLDDPALFTALPTLRPMPAVLRAIRPGSTTVRATGQLPCHRAQPPCLAPIRSFQVSVLVGPRLIQEEAPIDAASIRPGAGSPPEYLLDVVSGLPSGCAEFDGYSVFRESEATVRVRVFNRMPADGDVACTTIYGQVASLISLGRDFASGNPYTVIVNDTTVLFTAG